MPAKPITDKNLEKQKKIEKLDTICVTTECVVQQLTKLLDNMKVKDGQR